MAKQVAASVGKDTSKLRELAVIPIQSSGKVNKQDAEVLAQILATEIVNSGRFAVFPRTSSLEQVTEEHKNQRSGETDSGMRKRLGIGDNPDYVLSVKVRTLGEKNMFTAAVLNVEDSSQGDETGRVDYTNLEDGWKQMAELSGKLTGSPKQGAYANMAPVPAGTFTMGSSNEEEDDDEKPPHQVTISKPFYIGKYEVTQKEWAEVMGTTVTRQRDMADKSWSLRGVGDNYPVYYVSWYDAIEYCNRRSIKEGLAPVYGGSGDYITCNFAADGYRLPTEAEWEWAAKGGGKDFMIYEYAGSNSAGGVAWYADNSGGQTHPVGTKAGNSLGIYDMSGNVWEWCWDWYGSYSGGSRTDPAGAASGSNRV
jgi:formylglycine-generating enzyme required for sulfatase activity